MVVFCNEGEPFTLILNGERINATPQTRVRAEGLTLKKYETKVVFQNSKLKDANTTITFFYSGYECEFGVNKKSKKKYKIEYFTDKKIDGSADNEGTGNNSTNNQSNGFENTNTTYTSNTTNTDAVPTLTVSETNTLLTGPGILSDSQINNNTGINSIKCNTPMSDARVLSIIGAIKDLPNDTLKHSKAILMMEGACITVNQLKQVLDTFFSEDSKYTFAKQVYERTKDNPEFHKLSEVFMDVVVKNKFQKFLQSKK